FSCRRRHTRFSRDWSSDVCSSDLARRQALEFGRIQLRRGDDLRFDRPQGGEGRPLLQQIPGSAGFNVFRLRLGKHIADIRVEDEDRKSVVYGKSAVRESMCKI